MIFPTERSVLVVVKCLISCYAIIMYACFQLDMIALRDIYDRPSLTAPPLPPLPYRPSLTAPPITAPRSVRKSTGLARHASATVVMA